MDNKKKQPKAAGSKAATNKRGEEHKEKEKKKEKMKVENKTLKVKPNTKYSLMIQGPPPSSMLHSRKHGPELDLIAQVLNCPADRLFEFIYNLFNEKGKKFLAQVYSNYYHDFMTKKKVNLLATDWNGADAPWQTAPSNDRFGDDFKDTFYNMFGSGFTPGFETQGEASWKAFHLADQLKDDLMHRGYSWRQATDEASKAYTAARGQIKSSVPFFGNPKKFASSVLQSGGGMAPTAFGGHSSPHHMSIEQKDNVITCRGNIPLCNVQWNVGGSVNWFNLPGSTTVFDTANHSIGVNCDELGNRLALLASLYTLVKYKKMKMIYTPIVSTTTGGTNLAFGFNPDPSRADVTGGGFDYSEILQYQSCCTTAVWQPCELELPVHSDWLFTAIRDVANVAQERQACVGQLLVNSNNNPPGVVGGVFGTTSMDFEVEFCQPQVTYGLTLYSELSQKYSSDSLNFVLESMLSEPASYLRFLKEENYQVPEKVTPEIMKTFSMMGITLPHDPRQQKFEATWDSYNKVTQPIPVFPPPSPLRS